MDVRNFFRGCMAVSILTCSIVARADTWFFDFGATEQATAGYNNITNPGIHTVSGLINSAGQPTSASLAVIAAFSSAANTGGTTTPGPSVEFPSSATRDSLFGSVNVTNPRFQLSGLKTTERYSFTVFASRKDVADNREAEYRFIGANSLQARLNASNNATEVAVANGVQPTPDGKIVVDLRAGPNNDNSDSFFYINAMKVVGVATGGCGDPSLDDKVTEYRAGTGITSLGHHLYRPARYSAECDKRYPLLVWLHGIGERCDADSPMPLSGLVTRSDLNSPGYQIRTGSAYDNERPFLQGLIILPQTCWGWDENNVDRVIEDARAKLRVDDTRIYVTGLSNGAHGTWLHVARKTAKVAAVVPIAGTAAALAEIHKASHVPIWAFHNWNDSGTLNPETDLFRCSSAGPTYTHRLCTIEHIERMTPFASTRVMDGYGGVAGGPATKIRTASLSRVGDALLPTQWTWDDGTPGHDS
jgi:predicted esterase